eukprot:COSAG02_NODE_37606_length_439_cov_4.064706_1_plen_88_part_10
MLELPWPRTLPVSIADSLRSDKVVFRFPRALQQATSFPLYQVFEPAVLPPMCNYRFDWIRGIEVPVDDLTESLLHRPVGSQLQIHGMD